MGSKRCSILTQQLNMDNEKDRIGSLEWIITNGSRN